MSADLRAHWHDAMLDHEAPRGAFKLPPSDLFATAEPHPDMPERARNVRNAVETAVPGAEWIESGPATVAELERAHDPEYVEWFREFCADGGGWIGETTTGATADSYRAARHAAGAALGAARDALEFGLGDGVVPYALCRPSGHHAQSDRADGFCFFNNAAVAAANLLAAGDVDRVAVVDWDVHHGNGTQEVFYDRDDVLLVSLHNDHGAWDDYYHPQTGGLEEVGEGDGEGYTVNVPLPPGTGNGGYGRAFDRIVEPVVAEYDPDLLLASAGGDPGVADPLGRNTVTRSGFRDLARRARELAAEHADGRLAVLQEGGYQITHLAIATVGHLEGMLGRQVDLSEHGIEGDPFAMYGQDDAAVERWVEEAVDAHGAHWSLGGRRRA